MAFLHSLGALEDAGSKLDGLRRLARVGLPTPKIYVLEHTAFLEHKAAGFSPELLDELKLAWTELAKDGGVLTVRAAFEQDGVPILVRSQTNLPSFDDMLSAITRAWTQAQKMGANKSAKLRIILQRFFESEKMGHLHTSFSQDTALIEVLPGQVVYAMTRGDAKPDSYVINKSDFSLASKTISRKNAKMVKTDVGLKEVPTTEEEVTAESLSLVELQQLVTFGNSMEKENGPQEMEFAVTPDGSLIFFDSRNSRISKSKNGFSVCHGEARGTLKTVRNMEELDGVSPEHVVVLKKPSIDLVTFLALKHRPAGAVLIGASPSSHSATILREAKVPSISLKFLPFSDGSRVTLDASSGKLELANR